MALQNKKHSPLKMTPERRARVAHIETRLAGLIPDYIIIKECSKAWGIKSDEISVLIRLAYEGMARRAVGVNVEERRTQYRLAAQLAHMEAVEQGNVALQLKALEFLSKLDGLQQTYKVEIGGTVGAAAALGAGVALGSLGLTGPEAVRARIVELRQKLFPALPPSPDSVTEGEGSPSGVAVGQDNQETGNVSEEE